MSFNVLNPIIQACPTKIDGPIDKSNDFIEKNNNIFDVGTFIEFFSHALIGREICSRNYL